MSFLKWPDKDPDEILDYEIVWSARLLTDVITNSTWFVPVGIDKDTDSFADTATTIWLSGGTVGEHYDITNRIMTLGGRTMDQTVRIKIKVK